MPSPKRNRRVLNIAQQAQPPMVTWFFDSVSGAIAVIQLNQPMQILTGVPNFTTDGGATAINCVYHDPSMMTIDVYFDLTVGSNETIQLGPYDPALRSLQGGYLSAGKSHL